MSERKEIEFYCSQEEYDLIMKNAYNSHKSVSSYIKEAATNPTAININYDALTESTKKIKILKAEMHRIITMIVQTKQAYPLDIQRMISILEEINDTQKETLKLTAKESKDVRKQIKKVLSEEI